MAGEYVRWLARDVKPLEKKELTPEEKRRNWWDYHKWHVLIAVVCLVFAVDLVSDVVHNARNKPDYKIAYVGSTDLPEDTARALETALAALGEDLNGNGTFEPNELYVFYTHNHYNDFREYLNYYGGWGEMFGNITGGGTISSKYDYNPTDYVEVVHASLSGATLTMVYYYVPKNEFTCA